MWEYCQTPNLDANDDNQTPQAQPEFNIVCRFCFELPFRQKPAFCGESSLASKGMLAGYLLPRAKQGAKGRIKGDRNSTPSEPPDLRARTFDFPPCLTYSFLNTGG
jgi:hypothetical protein